MKNSNDTIGNRTRDLLACSTVPQPTVPPRAPIYIYMYIYISVYIYIYRLYVVKVPVSVAARSKA